MSLAPALRSKLESIVASDRVVVFMKGSPDSPQCGFSAQVVSILNRLLPAYGHFDVLADRDVREGIKEFSSWPTIPQVYIDGEFVGYAGDFSSGQMPLTLAAGRHRVELEAGGFRPASFDITIVSGQVIPYRGTLAYDR